MPQWLIILIALISLVIMIISTIAIITLIWALIHFFDAKTKYWHQRTELLDTNTTNSALQEWEELKKVSKE